MFKWIKETLGLDVDSEEFAEKEYSNSCIYYNTATTKLGLSAQPIDLCYEAYSSFFIESNPNHLLNSSHSGFRIAMEGAIMHFACLQHPYCGESLSLFIFSQRFPEVARKHEKYQSRFLDLMGDILYSPEIHNWEYLNTEFNKNNTKKEKHNPFPVLPENLY